MSDISTALLRKRSHPFTQIPNALINDKRVSFRAKGIWALIESKPDGWVFRETNLITTSKEGRDAFRKAIRELIEVGWLKRHQEQGPGGRFVTIYELIYEISPLTGNPHTVVPSTESQAAYKTRESKKEDSPPNPQGGERDLYPPSDGFKAVCGVFRKASPARTDEDAAWMVWREKGCEADAGPILRAAEALARTPMWQDSEGRYVPKLSKFLRDGLWKGAVPVEALPKEEREARAEALRKQREEMMNADRVSKGLAPIEVTA